MGFFKIITPEGVVDIDELTVEDLMGIEVALMAEEKK